VGRASHCSKTDHKCNGADKDPDQRLQSFIRSEGSCQGRGRIAHVASPFSYAIADNEKDLIQPAINSVNAILRAASVGHRVRRIVLTSSFAAVVDIKRKAPPRFTHTEADWNPQTCAESVDHIASPVIRHQGSKKFAELHAWNFGGAKQVIIRRLSLYIHP
jgi:nucleoside-diphosphate-sugar epimerase